MAEEGLSGGRPGTHLRAERIWVHQRFHACRGESRGRKEAGMRAAPPPRSPSIPRLRAHVRGQKPCAQPSGGAPRGADASSRGGGGSPTLAFIALWFFLVFFRNCFRLPEETYSVMKITCRGGVRVGPGTKGALAPLLPQGRLPLLGSPQARPLRETNQGIPLKPLPSSTS